MSWILQQSYLLLVTDLVECYFWALGAFPEPELGLSRRILAKNAVIFTMMDDVYDVHGTVEELELFIDTIQRWDTSVKGLLDYMRIIFEAVIGSLDEIEQETIKKGRPYCADYVKEEVKKLMRAYMAYMTEQRWFNKAAGAMCDASKEVFDWLATDPKTLVAAADHCRLMDDIVTHEVEQERGDVASSVECYMKQFKVSQEQAHDEIKKFIESDWKIINEELCINETAIPKRILKICVNYARVMEVLYKDNDAFTSATTRTKEMMAGLLVNPIPV
ncbi:hypothetical protein Tsubulata_011785 [Turnera subulata]|uniref:Terpene synthase metal-binding domain-containing protein n=1 Tax=Turnera subulata TaxID=218843 RepID=A0A9Q0JP84_9ROSI|nr:hypothetical protein Tsubulata_011785 [Turnera subulata]